jgi:nitroreductase
MDFFEVIEKRQSIRAYKNTPVEEDKIRKIVEAGRIAPSANNSQDWKFIVVKDDLRREKLAHACAQQKFVFEAPLMIVGCSTKPDYVMTCGQKASSIDLSIALTHMMLAATALELGTCWLGAFHEDKVKRVLKIPDEVSIIGILTIGYAHYTPPKTNRKSINEVVSFDRWV